MGCDIDFFVERKIKDEYLAPKARYEGLDRWISCDTWIETEDTISFQFTYELVIPNGKKFYEDRNNKLFDRLTGIKNFADVEVMAEPRGLPEDVSELVNNANKRLEGDCHSHSWFTLEELLKEDWTGDEYKDFRVALEKMKKIDTPKNVRAVFWFD